MRNPLDTWMSQASPDEKRALASLAQLPSTGDLHQMAKAYRTNGKLSLTPDVARRLDEASRTPVLQHLPALAREELCPACGRCDFALLVRRDYSTEELS